MKFSSIFTSLFLVLITSAVAAPLPNPAPISDQENNETYTIDRRAAASAPADWDTSAVDIQKIFTDNNIAPAENTRYVFEVQRDATMAKALDPKAFTATEENEIKKIQPAAKQAAHRAAALKLKQLQKNLGYMHSNLVVVGLKKIATGPPNKKVFKWAADPAVTASKKLDFSAGPKGFGGSDDNSFKPKNLPFDKKQLTGKVIYKGSTPKKISDIETIQNTVAQGKLYTISVDGKAAGSYFCGSISTDLAAAILK